MVQKHTEAILAAARRIRARSIALVGSVALGDDTDSSDYDFLVDFEDEADLFDVQGSRWTWWTCWASPSMSSTRQPCEKAAEPRSRTRYRCDAPRPAE